MPLSQLSGSASLAGLAILKQMQPNACAVRKVKEDMVRKGQDAEQQSPRRRNALPSEVMEIIVPALQVGGSAGKLFLKESLPKSSTQEICA